MEQNRLESIVGSRIHSTPDVCQRKLNDVEVMEAAIARKVWAVVVNPHLVPTADQDTLVNRMAQEKYGNVPFAMMKHHTESLRRWAESLD